MIEYIKGQVTELTPTYVVIETQGIGYLLNISLVDYSSLADVRETCLYVHEVIREDAHLLFGFVDRSSRSLFRELIGVSGVGANTARMILSAFRASDLQQIIVSGDVARLKSVKGIGAKTAQRIIVDLKDKIKPTDDTLLIETTHMSESFDEALAALTMLGFARPASQKVLRKLYEATPGLKVEQAIKQALTML